MKQRLLPLLLNLFMLSGCMVGPDYAPPVTLIPDAFSESRPAETEDMTEEDLAHWWTVFNDSFLNALLEESLQGNFDFKIALEKICQARAAYWVEVTAILPEIDSDLQAVRTRASQTLTTNSFLNIPPIQNFYQAGLDAIWQIDLFGGLRRAARAAYDTWEATLEDARGVRIILLSDVAITYTNICAFQEAADIAAERVRLDEDLLELATARFQSGLANEQEVESFRAALDADIASLLVFETNVKQAIYSLSILLGRTPESLLTQFEEKKPIPSATGKIPSGLPADLLRRRPDIRSAERQIAAATEQVGVAVADLFPKISLTGSSGSFSANPLQGANVGYASNSFKKWFTSPSRIWGIGGLVTWPLFDFGKRIAVIQNQVSVEYQALFTYEKTVIAALQEVESDLVAYFNEEERVISLSDEVEANRRIYDLTADLYQAGLANFTQVLQAREVLLDSLSTLIASEQALSVNLIALYKAMGGGWEIQCCSMP